MSDDITCRCCGTTMATDRCESERETTTCWHSCATCGHVRMTSERQDMRHAAPLATLDDDLDESQIGFDF